MGNKIFRTEKAATERKQLHSLLLNGPVMSDEEYETYQRARQWMNQRQNKQIRKAILNTPPMPTDQMNFTDIDSYIAAFPESVQAKLQELRQAIRQAAPDAQETISYQMPTFTLNGNLVHFAAFKNHIGFYSLPSGHAAFAGELAAYQGGKGSVQFPLNQPLPLDLVRRIVAFRVEENLAKSKKKK